MHSRVTGGDVAWQKDGDRLDILSNILLSYRSLDGAFAHMGGLRVTKRCYEHKSSAGGGAVGPVCNPGDETRVRSIVA